jgi:hypothetical protein
MSCVAIENSIGAPPEEFYGPLSNPARAISISEHVIQQLICQYSDSMGLKIVSELPHAHDYSIAYLLHLWVIFFGASESFGTEIYWDLV